MQLKFQQTIAKPIRLRGQRCNSCILYLSSVLFTIGYNVLLFYALVWEAGNIVNLPTKRIGFYNFCLWDAKVEQLHCFLIGDLEKLGVSKVALVLSRICVYIPPVLCLFAASTVFQQILCFRDRDGWKLVQILLFVSSLSLPVGLALFLFPSQNWVQVSELSEVFAALTGAYILILFHLIVITLYLAHLKDALPKEQIIPA